MTPSFDFDAFYATSLAQLTGEGPAELDSDQRWSTWPETAHTLDRGPQPFPSWVVQHDGAIDTELGVLKTGKEADAHLLERALPAAERTGADGEAALLVAKRYRSPEHTSFHRSHEYTEGRRVRDSREARAMARGTAFGREAAAGRWARAEFDVLGRLFSAGLPVPYPVQLLGTEVCMEFIGTDDGGTPRAGARLHEMRPDPELAARWAGDLRGIVLAFARLGLAHGDLSAYNVLVDPRDEAQSLVVIDVPQVVDLIAHPAGSGFLARDCRNLCTWLRGQGAPAAAVDAEEWAREAMSQVV